MTGESRVGGPVIRPARRDDVPRLKQLGVLGWETTYADFVRPENRASYLAGDFWSHAALGRVVADPAGIVLVAVDGADHPIGFLSIEPYHDDERVELTRFYVDPRWRRAGIGAALWAAALERIDRDTAPGMLVNVFARNLAGRAFYEKAGCVLVELCPVPVGDEVVDDAWYELPFSDDRRSQLNGPTLRGR